MKLSIIIPVYNERRTIAKVLVAASAALPDIDKELIVVDDGSVDGTRDWLRSTFPSGTRAIGAVNLDSDGNLAFAARVATPREKRSAGRWGKSALVCREVQARPKWARVGCENDVIGQCTDRRARSPRTKPEPSRYAATMRPATTGGQTHFAADHRRLKAQGVMLKA